MGQARELMDKITEAVFNDDLEALRGIYADDVVVTTPDAGTLHGLDEALAYHRALNDAFPQMSYEMTATHESGSCAIDQGDVIGRNTGPIALPDGRTMPATGKQVRLRTIDVATVEGGRVKRHDLYFDQLEMLVQLGLVDVAALTPSG